MRLHSMTAYGFGESLRGDTTYSCEIRTLNSRFLEVSVRLPRHVMALEAAIVNQVKSSLKRGKVDVFIDVNSGGSKNELPQLDVAAAIHYSQVYEQLHATLGGKVALQAATPADFLQLEGVLVTNSKGRLRGPVSTQEHEEPVFATLDQALLTVKEARLKEGISLGVAMMELVHYLGEERNKVSAKRDVIMQHLQKNHLRRLESILTNLQKISGGNLLEVTPERLMTEVAILSDKIDIDEELTRLATHCDEFLRLLDREDGVGRKLDFLCQEMHREVNTMTNKLVQTDVAQHTMEMKQTIERLRQQVQNIE
jgi:uncharacterized protein (TIGR00255 family)